MTLILSGTDGLSDVDGSAATPAIRGTDANTGIFFPAADTIAFSEGGVEAMRIDSSGNVGIGTASPNASYKMSITGNSASIYSGILFTDTNAGGGVFSIYGESAALKFRDSSAGATRMVIDSSGNVGIGTSSPTARLTVAYTADLVADFNSTNASGGYMVWRTNGTVIADIGTAQNIYGTGGSDTFGINARGARALLFGTNNTERMRIDSSGNLLVGTTSRYSTEKTSIYSASGTDCGLVVQNLGGSGNNGIRSIIATGGNNTSTAHFQGTTNGVANWYLYGNGTTSYSSDARLKKNIETTRDGYIDDVMKLRVVKYNWKNSEDGTPKELGMIAQEIEEVFPNLVQDDLSPISDEDPIRYKQVKWSVLPFILLKALQEQQAIITQLQADVAALKAQP